MPVTAYILYIHVLLRIRVPAVRYNTVPYRTIWYGKGHVHGLFVFYCPILPFYIERRIFSPCV
jgi:hypothetical protein